MLLSLIGALHLDHLEVPDQGVLMNFLVHLHFSKESSTTCCYLPPLLSETRDHLWYNGIASWTHAQSVLYRCNSQRGLGGFEAVQLWSHKSTFKIYLKSQILNLFEMSNISNLFEMSSSTFVWNQRSPLIQSHCFMNTCTECSGCSQIRQMVVFWLPSILFHFPGWFQSRKSYLYCIVNKVVGSQPKVWKGGTRQIKVDIIYRKLFKDGLTSILPHSAFRMGISQVCKVFSFACWSYAAFKAHLRRFRACFI